MSDPGTPFLLLSELFGIPATCFLTLTVQVLGFQDEPPAGTLWARVGFPSTSRQTPNNDDALDDGDVFVRRTPRLPGGSPSLGTTSRDRDARARARAHTAVGEFFKRDPLSVSAVTVAAHGCLTAPRARTLPPRGLTSVHAVPPPQLPQGLVPRLQVPAVIRGEVHQRPVFQAVRFQRVEQLAWTGKNKNPKMGAFRGSREIKRHRRPLSVKVAPGQKGTRRDHGRRGTTGRDRTVTRGHVSPCAHAVGLRSCWQRDPPFGKQNKRTQPTGGQWCVLRGPWLRGYGRARREWAGTP